MMEIRYVGMGGARVPPFQYAKADTLQDQLVTETPTTKVANEVASYSLLFES